MLTNARRLPDFTIVGFHGKFCNNSAAHFAIVLKFDMLEITVLLHSEGWSRVEVHRD